MRWSVFLLDETCPLPAQEIAKLLVATAGGVIFDHVQQVRIHHGWVARGLDEPPADRLVEALAGAGFPALKKSEDRLIPLDKKYGVHKALLLDDGFHYQADLAGKLLVLPWPSLKVVSVGSVTTLRLEQVTEKKGKGKGNMLLKAGLFLATGIPPLPKFKSQTKTTTVQVEDEAILIHLVFSGSPVVMEIRATEFDYGYLGARRAPTSRENLVLLLADFRRLATGAHLTDLTSTFLDTAQMETEFKSDKDFLAFNRWIAEKTIA